MGHFEELVMLAIMKLGKDAYGASIYEALEEAGRDVSIGALYTTLSRLEAKGWVNSWFGEPTPARGGRAKKFFKIEGKGRKALASAHSRRVNLTQKEELALQGKA